MLKKNMGWGAGLGRGDGGGAAARPLAGKDDVEAEPRPKGSGRAGRGRWGSCFDEFFPAELADCAGLFRALAATGPAGGWCWQARSNRSSCRAYAATGIDLISSSARYRALVHSMRFTEWALKKTLFCFPPPFPKKGKRAKSFFFFSFFFFSRFCGLLTDRQHGRVAVGFLMRRHAQQRGIPSPLWLQRTGCADRRAGGGPPGPEGLKRCNQRRAAVGRRHACHRLLFSVAGGSIRHAWR